MCLLCGAKALIFYSAPCLEDALDTPTPLKTEAHNLIDRLPDDASWDDLMYQIYVRQAIEAGVRDADAGRVLPHDQAVARLRRPA
jgi:hypothetical protein